MAKLAWIAGPACRMCGAPIPPVGTAGATCPRCTDYGLKFDRTVALGVYQGFLQELVLRTKGRAEAPLTLGLGRILAARVASTAELAEPDVVVPVPMYWLRRLRRGVNGPDLLAECVARRLGAPLASRLLRRTRNTPPQRTLPPTERRKNIRGALAMRAGYHLKRAHVLLVDDVLTTGGTCNEAARVLKQNGAALVSVAVVARGIGAT